MLHLTSRVYLRLANRPSAQFQNSSIQERPSSSRMTLKRQRPVLPYFKSRKSISLAEPPLGVFRASNSVDFFPTICSTRETKKNPTNELRTRTNLQCFLNKVPRSSFKKLITCCKPPRYVPYKGTYVPYDGTFGKPDQGQTLDV
jgi:hypothetical protein